MNILPILLHSIRRQTQRYDRGHAKRIILFDSDHTIEPSSAGWSSCETILCQVLTFSSRSFNDDEKRRTTCGVELSCT